jgi:hypothetical protein
MGNKYLIYKLKTTKDIQTKIYAKYYHMLSNLSFSL